MSPRAIDDFTAFGALCDLERCYDLWEASWPGGGGIFPRSLRCAGPLSRSLLSRFDEMRSLNHHHLVQSAHQRLIVMVRYDEEAGARSGEAGGGRSCVAFARPLRLNRCASAVDDAQHSASCLKALRVVASQQGDGPLWLSTFLATSRYAGLPAPLATTARHHPSAVGPHRFLELLADKTRPAPSFRHVRFGAPQQEQQALRVTVTTRGRRLASRLISQPTVCGGLPHCFGGVLYPFFTQSQSTLHAPPPSLLLTVDSESPACTITTLACRGAPELPPPPLSLA